jgi:serine/threonine protein kinase
MQLKKQVICCVAELIAQRESSTVAVDGRAADMWSLGCTMYSVFMGELPFHEASKDTSKEYQGTRALELFNLCAGFGRIWLSGKGWRHFLVIPFLMQVL